MAMAANIIIRMQSGWLLLAGFLGVFAEVNSAASSSDSTYDLYEAKKVDESFTDTRGNMRPCPYPQVGQFTIILGRARYTIEKGRYFEGPVKPNGQFEMRY